jgi:hypothetical protein
MHLELLLELGVEALLGGHQRFGEQLALGLEVVEDGGRAGAHPLRDVGDPGGLQTALPDHFRSRLEDLLPPEVGDLRARAHALPTTAKPVS